MKCVPLKIPFIILSTIFIIVPSYFCLDAQYNAHCDSSHVQFTYNMSNSFDGFMLLSCHFRFRMTIPSKQAYPIPPLGPNLGSKGSCIIFMALMREGGSYKDRERERKRER